MRCSFGDNEKLQVEHIASVISSHHPVDKITEEYGINESDRVGDEDTRIKALSRSVGPMLARLIPETGPWYKNKHLIKLNAILCVTCLAASTAGYDFSLINGLQAFPEWQLDLMKNPKSEWLGFIVITLAIGSIVGNIVGPQISDRRGRKKVIYAGLVMIIGVSLGQAFSNNDVAFIVTRVLIGFSAALMSQTVVLVSELSYPTYRPFFSCFYMTMYYVGSFLGAWVSYGSRNLGGWSWKLVCLMQILFPILMAPVVLFYLPESPRWYVSKDRIDEARETLIKFHGGGDPRYLPMINFELEEMSKQINLTRGLSLGWLSMFKTKGNRWRSLITITLGIFQQWNGVGVISYYLVQVLTSVGITDVTSQTLINGFLQFWNFLWAAFASFQVDRFGRRVLFLWSTIGMLLSYVIITGLSAAYAELGNDQAGIGVVVFLFIYYAHYDIAFTPLVTCYPVEIWPFVYRAKGIAMQHVANYGSLLFNQFVNPIALEAIAWKYYFVYIGVLIVMFFVIYFTYPETKGFSLEEVNMIFDSKDNNEDE